jgi:hypothetical protein
MIAIAVPLGVTGLAINTITFFLIFVALFEVFAFMTIGPLNIAILKSVDDNLRGMAVALNNLMLHLFGDFPSPLIIGVLNETVGMYWAIMIAILWLGMSLFFFFPAYLLASSRLNKSVSETQPFQD